MTAATVDTGPAAALAAALAAAGCIAPVVGDPLAAAGTGPRRVAVVLLDRWALPEVDALSRAVREGGGPCVPVRLDGGLVLVGPVVRPAGPACLSCAERARLRVFGPTVPIGPGLRLGGVLAPASLPAVASLIADMAAAPIRHERTVVALRADQSTVSSHQPWHEAYDCPVCTPMPPDTPDAARVDLPPTPTTDPWSMRGPNPLTDPDTLRAVLSDFRHGPVAHLRLTEQSIMALATAEIAGDKPIRDAGHGRSRDYRQAERVALLEAVERMTGMRPYRRRTALTASFEELGPERAVDPARLGLPEPCYDGHPRSRTVPYRPDLPTRWVYGWSLASDRPIALPEHVAYWGLPPDAAPRFVHESSNGCGLGNSLVEAVLYGLLEVAERDAFLLAWYARAPLPRLRVPDDDWLLPHLSDRLAAAGYELLLYDATNDLGVPCVLSLARHTDPESPAPQAFFAAGAHPDPRAAIRAAAAEAAVDVFSYPDHVRRRPGHLDRGRLLPMLAEPERVASLDDHVAMHTLPEARERYAFLLRDHEPPVTWRQRWPGLPEPVSDLGAYLRDLVARVAGLGLDVIVVNQTAPRLRDRLGLHSAKVIVPGALPMTFGHVNRRTRGLPRLCEVPYRLGWSPAPLRYAELALHPHPFP